MTEAAPCIWVLAGTNGAGKSSVGGAMIRQSGGEYFNPDEVAAALIAKDSVLDQTAANGLAWRIGVRQLKRAIEARHNYFLETTLGGKTIARLLETALDAGFEVRIWYVGLQSVQHHLDRVAARVHRGGHDIPADAIRKRFDDSRLNLVRLLPRLAELRVFDNTAEACPAEGRPPRPVLVLHWRAGQVIAPADPRATPDWAKPIVAKALQLGSSER